jgi:hypothetical protein
MSVTPVTLWTPEHDDALAWVVAFAEDCERGLRARGIDPVTVQPPPPPSLTGDELAAYFCDREPMTRQAA